MTERPDFAELIRSPYDDDPKDPTNRFLLFVPIVAVAVGVAAGFGLAANRPSAEAAAVAIDTTTTTTEPRVAAPSDGFPEGFTPMTDDVAVAVETTYEVGGDSYVVLATAARGSLDHDSTFTPSVASWTLRTSDGDVEMLSQTVNDFAEGMFQVRFPGPIPDGAVLIARPAGSLTKETVRVMDGVPTEMSVEDPILFEVDGVPVALSDLSWSLTRGFAAWQSPEDVPMTVDVIVSFVGTEGDGTGDLPIRIMSFESNSAFLDTSERTDVPAWNTEGELVLSRAGAFRFNEEDIVDVTVDVIVGVVTDSGADIEIPFS